MCENVEKEVDGVISNVDKLDGDFVDSVGGITGEVK